MSEDITQEFQSHLSSSIRRFSSGATRDTSLNKPSYSGYLDSRVIERFGQYMLKHQVQSDGSLRPADNWKKGIPLDAYFDSLFRHFMELWKMHEYGREYAGDNLEEALCALMFNTMGYLSETLKAKNALQVETPSSGTQQAPGD